MTNQKRRRLRNKPQTVLVQKARNPVSGVMSYKRDIAHAVVMNAIGAAAFMGPMGSLAWAAESSATITMPEVVVTAQQETDPSYKVEAISSPKYTVPLLDVPQTITVVPKAVVESQGAVTLRDVLKNVPGISIQAGEGGVPAGDQMSIRGFSARTDMFIDGVRDTGGYARDSFNFEQIEVVKGPASVYSGRGSTGGAINMDSKDPALRPFNRAEVGLGTDSYKRATLDVNAPIKEMEGVAVRLNAMVHDADVPGRDVIENQRFGIAPSIAFGLGTETRTTLSYFHLDQDNIPSYGIPWVPDTNVPLAAYAGQPAPVDYSNFYGLVNRDYEDIATDLATLKFEHDFSDDLTLRNVLRYGKTDRDSIITAPRFVSDASTDIRRNDWKSRDQADDILVNQTDITSRFETGRLDHTLVTGLELSKETEENWTRVKTGADSPVTDLYHPDPNDPYTENIQRDGSKTQTDADSIGIYAFDTIKFNEQWQAQAGLRWDRFDVDYRSIAVDQTVTPLGRTDEKLTWRGGVVYKPKPNGSIYAAYGTSFNPSAEGLSLSSSATSTSNVDTAPEENESYEIGTKWDLLDEKLTLSGAIFRTNKTNARTQDPADSSDMIVLEGEQRVDGLELGVSGRITEKLQAFAGYTFMTSEVLASKNVDEVGKEVSNTPEHTFNLWMTYDLTEAIQLGGGAQFVDDRFSSNTNNRKAPDYWTLDAMAAYKINENITLRLNVYNLADEEYIESVGGGHVIPGAGRSAVLSTSFKW